MRAPTEEAAKRPALSRSCRRPPGILGTGAHLSAGTARRPRAARPGARPPRRRRHASRRRRSGSGKKGTATRGASPQSASRRFPAGRRPPARRPLGHTPRPPPRPPLLAPTPPPRGPSLGPCDPRGPATPAGRPPSRCSERPRLGGGCGGGDRLRVGAAGAGVGGESGWEGENLLKLARAGEFRESICPVDPFRSHGGSAPIAGPREPGGPAAADTRCSSQPAPVAPLALPGRPTASAFGMRPGCS